MILPVSKTCPGSSGLHPPWATRREERVSAPRRGVLHCRGAWVFPTDGREAEGPPVGMGVGGGQGSTWWEEARGISGSEGRAWWVMAQRSGPEQVLGAARGAHLVGQEQRASPVQEGGSSREKGQKADPRGFGDLTWTAEAEAGPTGIRQQRQGLILGPDLESRGRGWPCRELGTCPGQHRHGRP